MGVKIKESCIARKISMNGRCVLVIRHQRRFFVVDDVDFKDDLHAFAAYHVSRTQKNTRSRATALLVAHNKAAKSKPSHGVHEIGFDGRCVESEYVRSKMIDGVFCPTPDLCPSPSAEYDIID